MIMGKKECEGALRSQQMANVLKFGTLLLMLVMFFWLSPSSAFADNLGNVADRLSDQAEYFKSLGTKLGIVIGIFLVVIGFVKLSSSRQQQQGIGGAIAFIAIGIMLVSLSGVINLGSESIFGSDDNVGKEGFLDKSD